MVKLRKYYFRGVGVGLVIAWVTSGLAYLHSGTASFVMLIEFEFVVSVAMFIVSILIARNAVGGD
jgi:hypothetical protein